MSLVSRISNEEIERESQVTALNDNVKKYIPSLKDEDIGQFGIIAGKLYYIGDNELAIKAAQSQKIAVMPEDKSLNEFIDEVERLAIESLVLAYGGDAFKNADNNPLGTQLFDKIPDNSTNWKVITEVENNSVKATYGTDWYFVQTGTEVNGLGTLKQNYIINYDKRLAVKFDATKHVLMSVKDTLAVDDHLIFNADPSTMEKYNNLNAAEKANFDIDKELGEGIKFHGYFTDKNGNGFQDEDEPTDLSKAFTATSFKFDGYDDHITFPYDGSTDLKYGFTFEFYGILTGKSSHWNYGEIDSTTGYYKSVSDKASFNGLLVLKHDAYSGSTGLRFGFYPRTGKIWRLQYNYGGKEDVVGEPDGWTTEKYPYNHYITVEDYDFNFNEPIYFSIVLSPEMNSQTVYKDGKKILNSFLNKLNYDTYFQGNSLSDITEIAIGTCSMESSTWWHFPEMDCYSMRLYNRDLTESEVLANYNATVSYHDFLENGGKAETGGETGGDGY